MSNRNELKWGNVQMPGTAKNFAGWNPAGLAVEIPGASAAEVAAGAVDDKPITPASLASSGVLHYKGSFANLAALTVAFPTAAPGDYALVDASASPALMYIWDATDTLWRGASGVTSVAVAAGTTGTDVNITGSPITTSGTITINIPDASATARGLITTGTQTIAGAKTFSTSPAITGLPAGAVVLGGTGGQLTHVSTQLFWNTTNSTFLVGTNVDTYQLKMTVSASFSTIAGMVVQNTNGGVAAQSVYAFANNSAMGAWIGYTSTAFSTSGNALANQLRFELQSVATGGMLFYNASTTAQMVFSIGSTAVSNLTIGNTGIFVGGNGIQTATAALQLRGGNSAAGGHSLKFNNNVFPTVAEDGGMSYAGNLLAFDHNSGRKYVVLSDNTIGTGQVPFGTASTFTVQSSVNFTYALAANRLQVSNLGTSTAYFGNVISTATAKVHIAAGAAAVNSAPLKFTSGTALTTPEDGAVEYHSSHLYFTIGSTRYQLDQQGGGGSVTLSPIGSTPNANGLTLTGSALNLEPASASFGGAVTTAAQTFAGAKTFNDIIATPGLGIGVAATSTRVIHISQAAPTGVQIYLINNDAGVAAIAGIVVNNGTSSGSMQMYGTGTATPGLLSVLGGGPGGMTVGAAHASGIFTMQAGGAERARITETGRFGVGVIGPTARLHLPAGTAAANTAPLKFTSGTPLTTPENGVLEYDNDHLWFTSSSVRRQLDEQGGGIGTANQVLGVDNSGSISEWKTISIGTTAQSNNIGWVLTGSQAIVLHIPDASSTVRGVMTTGAQTFSGAKTFASSPAITGFTGGSVLFYNTGVIAQNNAQLFWSTASTALCIGTTTVLHKVTVESSADSFTGLAVNNPNTGVNTKAGIHFSAGGLTVQVGILGANTVTSGNKKAGQLEFSLGSGLGMNVLTTNTTGTVTFCTNNDNSNTRLHIGHTGVGIGTPASVGGVLTPTAALHLPAGAAAAGSAPLKFISGTAMTTPENGALEYHTSHLYFTIGSTRFQLDQQGGGGSPGGANTEVQINNSSAFGGGKLFISTPGNLIFGDTSIAGSRTLTVQSSSTNASMAFEAKGGGSFTWLLPDTTSKTVTLSSITAGGTLVRFTNSAAQGAIGLGTAIASINNTARIGGQTADYIEFSMVAGVSGLTRINCADGAGAGMPWTIKGMAAGGTNQKGGDIIIEVGDKVGTGLDGNIYIQALTGFLIIATIPTSSAGLPSGAIWSNSNVLTRVP